MRIVGLILVLVLLLLGVMNGGSVAYFIDMPSVIIVVGLTLGISLQRGVPLMKVIQSFFGVSFQGDDLCEVVQAWKQVRTYVMVSGLVSTLLGMITLFQALSVYDAFFPGTATALITTFYAVVLSYVVFLPLQHRLERQLGEV